jgi:hypothetical protein
MPSTLTNCRHLVEVALWSDHGLLGESVDLVSRTVAGISDAGKAPPDNTHHYRKRFVSDIAALSLRSCSRLAHGSTVNPPGATVPSVLTYTTLIT